MSFYSMDYYSAYLLWRSECVRRCRRFFARFTGDAQLLNLWRGAKHELSTRPRCPAYWRGSDRRWG